MIVLQGPKLSFENVFFTPSGRGLVAHAYQPKTDTALHWPTFETAEPRTFPMKGFDGRGWCANGLGLLATGTHLVVQTAGG